MSTQQNPLIWGPNPDFPDVTNPIAPGGNPSYLPSLPAILSAPQIGSPFMSQNPINLNNGMPPIQSGGSGCSCNGSPGCSCSGNGVSSISSLGTQLPMMMKRMEGTGSDNNSPVPNPFFYKYGFTIIKVFNPIIPNVILPNPCVTDPMFCNDGGGGNGGGGGNSGGGGYTGPIITPMGSGGSGGNGLPPNPFSGVGQDPYSGWGSGGSVNSGNWVGSGNQGGGGKNTGSGGGSVGTGFSPGFDPSLKGDKPYDNPDFIKLFNDINNLVGLLPYPIAVAMSDLLSLLSNLFLETGDPKWINMMKIFRDFLKISGDLAILLEGSEGPWAAFLLSIEVVEYLTSAAFFASLVILFAALATMPPSEVLKMLPFFQQVKWLLDKAKALIDSFTKVISDAIWTAIGPYYNQLLNSLIKLGIH